MKTALRKQEKETSNYTSGEGVEGCGGEGMGHGGTTAEGGFKRDQKLEREKGGRWEEEGKR